MVAVLRVWVLVVVAATIGLLVMSLPAVSGATESWFQVGADIDGEAADDASGWSVASSSDGATVAIGAPVNAGGSGHVRVFGNVGGVWTQVGDDILGEAAGDASGYAVALSSDGATVAIGARLNDGNGNNAGHVRVFGNVGGVWTQVGADIDGEAAGDLSGWSVALSSDGTTVAIGAPSNGGNGANAGHVRVFGNVGGVWTQVGADIDGDAAGDRSGEGLALSSDGATVATERAEYVRVFGNVGGVWTQVGADIDDEAAGDRSGYAVALSSDGATIAIGAHLNDGNGTNAGHVRVFGNVGGVWTQVGADIDGEAAGDLSGWSVALSSDGATVAIGAPISDGNGNNAGHVRVFTVREHEVCNGLAVTVDLSKGDEPTEGDDVIRGTSSADRIDGLGGNDTICSLQGDDIVNGGDGFDKVFGGQGADTITGGVGNDKLVGGPGNDEIRGGNGNDRLQGGDDDDTLDGENGLDRVAGGSGNDTLRGGTFADLLLGGLGRDALSGDEGDDVLKGGAWIDTFDGGAGSDGCTLSDPSGNIEVRISCETGVFGL